MWLAALAVMGSMMSVALAAPAVLLRTSPLRFPKARMAWYAGLVGALALLSFLVLALVARGGDDEGAVGWPAAVSTGITLVVVAISMRSLLPLRRATALARALARDRSRGATREELLRIARAAPPKDPRRYGAHGVLVLTVVGALADARLWDDAVTLLETLDEERSSPTLRATRAISLANCRMYLGDREAAGALLAGVVRPIPHRITEESFVASRALLRSITGAPADALRELEAAGAPTEPRLLRAHDIARAHAHAALGDEASARDVLHRLRAREGDDGLLRVAALSGPASALANALLRERESPYRG